MEMKKEEGGTREKISMSPPQTVSAATTTIHRKLDFANPIYVLSMLRDSPDREFAVSVSMPFESLWAEHQTQLAITP